MKKLRKCLAGRGKSAYFAIELRTLGAGTQPLNGKNNSISSYSACLKGEMFRTRC